MSTKRHWLWLSTRGREPAWFTNRLLDHFGSPEGVYFAGEDALEDVPDLPYWLYASLLNKDMAPIEGIEEECRQLGITILTRQDAGYPQRLLRLEDPPCVLYVKGQLPNLDEEPAITVVGTRKASPYGIMAASRLSMDLARHGAMLVSGTAPGVDSAAIRGALQGGGRVVSVLGCGLDVVYPVGNERLYEDVMSAGALISEYPPGTPPAGMNFPIRNRILAALSLGTLVVEGGMDSGALITARWAADLGRQIYAVPGAIDSPMSRGPNHLIRDEGAHLVQTAWDVLRDFSEVYPGKLRADGKLDPAAQTARLRAVQEEKGSRPRRKKPEKPEKAPPQPQEEETVLCIDRTEEPERLTDDQADILRALQGGAQKTSDELVEQTGLTARRVFTCLTRLQMEGLVEETEGKRFTTPVLLKE